MLKLHFLASKAVPKWKIHTLFCLSIIYLFFALPASAEAFELSPYKDRLFSYPDVLERSAGGDYRKIDYRELRDINGRDEIPERRVNQSYVSLKVRRNESISKTPYSHRFAGKTENARIITVYLHGQGGSSKQGMNDFTFGGNFNRIKNLMVRNDGLYLSLDFPDFGEGGERTVASVLHYYLQKSPAAEVFVACGSAGGQLCWRLAQNKAIVPRLGGLLLLGSLWDQGFLKSPAFKRRVPVFFGHGSRDTVFPIGKQEAFFRSISITDPGYPARFVRFETGTHGTPIRMTDWRETLNWMLAH